MPRTSSSISRVEVVWFQGEKEEAASRRKATHTRLVQSETLLLAYSFPWTSVLSKHSIPRHRSPFLRIHPNLSLLIVSRDVPLTTTEAGCHTCRTKPTTLSLVRKSITILSASPHENTGKERKWNQEIPEIYSLCNSSFVCPKIAHKKKLRFFDPFRQQRGKRN